MDVNVWINALTKPLETFKAEKSKGDLTKGIINYVIAGLIAGVGAFLYSLLFGAALGGAYGLASAGTGAIGIITTPIAQVIGALIGMGLVFIVAKVLGAKGSYTSLFYLASLFAVPIAVLNLIPLVGILASLYAIYLLFLALKVSQDMTDGKAALTILVLVAIVAALAIIMVVILGAALLGGLASAGALSGMGY